MVAFRINKIEVNTKDIPTKQFVQDNILGGLSLGHNKASLAVYTNAINRVHNARHKSVTSTLNTTFFKTSGLCIYFYVWTHRFNKKIKSLIIFIGFKWFMIILVALFDGPKNWNFMPKQ